jgi:predicted anti-sigma-YlaC factor YlaD
MFCDEALDAVEAIAAGEMMPDGRVASHLATCPNCAQALEDARQLEASLRQRQAPAAPPQFTSRTLARIRRARWRTDQFLDLGFNLAIGAVIVAVLVAVWMLLDRAGLAAISGDAVEIFGSGVVALARRIAPSVPLYAGAAAVLLSALGIWWWAERDATL